MLGRCNGLTAVGAPSAADTISTEHRLVGSIPYSNQWTFEELRSFLYIAYNRQPQSSAQLAIGPYLSTFGSNDITYPSVDYFIRVTRLGDPELSRFWGDLGLWTRYSLGLTVRRGHLASDAIGVSSTAETSYLAQGFGRFGPVLQFEGNTWIMPYVGAQFFFSGYRHTSTVSGAEAQGGGVGYELIGGLHFPVLFGHRLSAYGEARSTHPVSGKNLVANGFGFDTGLGLTF